MNNKRKRDHCFEYSEKVLLVNLVIDHFKVIESKKTDSVSVKMKNAEWVKIADEFAAGSSIYSRDSCSLKTLWENLKRKAKLAIAAQQADNQYSTGGGKAKNILIDPLVDTVISLICPQVEPFKNPYDDNDDIMSQSGNKKVSSRRRPVLGTSASDILLETKVSLLNSASADAKEEHELQMDILQLQKKQEEEKLKHVKMKTALLKFQLKRETGVEFYVDKII